MTLPVISRALLLLPVVSLLVQSGHGQINLLKQKPTSSQSGVVTRTVPDSVTPVETMAVDVDPTAQNTLATALPGTTLTLDLLPGHSFTALLENFNQHPDELHAYTWTGPIIEAPDAEFILSTYNSVTVASIALADGDIYSITYNGDGTHQVTKSHPVLNHVCGVDDHMHPPLQPAPTTPGVQAHGIPVPADAYVQSSAAPLGAADIAGEFDVLMAYTPYVRETNGGEDAVQALINMCFSYTNQAFVNSGLPAFRAIKAGTVEIDYVSVIQDGANGSGPFETELSRLVVSEDGHLDLVHPIRNGVQADLVHLLTPGQTGNIGLAYITGQSNAQAFAFGISSGTMHPLAVCQTVAHELGHNYGLNHNFSYDGIMSYNNEMRPYFSEPEVQEILANAQNLANYRMRQNPAVHLNSQLPNPSVNLWQGAVSNVNHQIFNVGSGVLDYTITVEAPWLSVFPPEGQISDTGTRSADLTVKFNTAGLSPGTYNANIIANGAQNSPYSIPVTMTVIDTAPVNDNFDSATQLTGSFGTVYGANINATVGASEATVPAGTHSVWYSWLATSNAPFTIDTEGSNFDTLLGVWTSDGVNRTLQTFNDDISPSLLQSRTTITPTSGTTYYISVATKENTNPQSGSIRLNWGNSPPPHNDNFANAQALIGTSGKVSTNNWYATKEPFEPVIIDGEATNNSLWYAWTAPWNGTTSVTTANSLFDTVLGVYTGSQPTLSSISENNDADGSPQSRVTFACEAGTTYYIAVAGANHQKGDLLLSWSTTAAVGPVLSANPGAFHFQTHQGIDVSPTQLRVGNSGIGTLTYSINTDAPWLHVFTPISMVADAGTEISHPVYFDTDSLAVGIYQATITLTSAESENSPLHIPVNLTITPDTVPPPNDNFINAINVTGKNGVAYGSGKSATAEGYTIAGLEDSWLEHSTWFKWETSESFPDMSGMTFATNGATTQSASLVLMTDRDSPISFQMFSDAINEVRPPGTPISLYAFADVPYYTYLFGTDTRVQLRWGTDLPGNDNFQDSQVIGDSSGTETFDTSQATRQSDEPAKIDSREASHSVWYSWEAPAEGTIWFNTIGSNFDTLLAVYTGTLGDLTPIAENDNSPHATDGESEVSFDHVSGQTYHIRIDGVNFQAGNAVLNWSTESVVGDWHLY